MIDMASRVPGALGVAHVGPCVADDQFCSVIGEVEYRMSYPVAVPELPSSPGAVQLRFIHEGLGQVSMSACEADASRSDITDGAVVSSLLCPVGTGVGVGTDELDSESDPPVNNAITVTDRSWSMTTVA